MTKGYIISPLAEDDLDNIFDYTVARWSREQAKAYFLQLKQDIQQLAIKPAKGRSCSEVRNGYYKYKSGSHFIFYRLTDNGIDIGRVLHERMDFRQYL